MDNNELTHWGIKGQRWGIRRFQNKDGSLTATGKKRLKTENYHEDYNKAHDNKSVKYMSDAELRARNNRLQMEKQYSSMTKKTSKGKNIVKGLIAAAGTIAAAETAYNTYKRLGSKACNNAIDKIGDWIMKDLSKGLSKGF